MLENVGQEEMKPFMATPSSSSPRHGEGRAGRHGEIGGRASGLVGGRLGSQGGVLLLESP